MDKEQELDELVEKVRSETDISFPPIFEMYVTLFSMASSVLLFIFPSMLQTEANIYNLMLIIMPQFAWGMFFFIAGIIKSIGLWLDIKSLRIVGLIMSTFLYATLSVCFYFNFPSFGAISFTMMTVFTLISISMVKRTKIER